MIPPKLFVATKAFITYQGKILLLREAGTYADGVNVGKFDVPGGRVEPGQRFDESLRREITEETGLTVEIGWPFYVGEWRPVVRGEAWQIVGTYFVCSAETDQVILSDDHSEAAWIDPEKFGDYPLIDNLRGVFEAYLKLHF